MKYKMKLRIPIYGWELVIYRMNTDGKTHKAPKELVDILPADMKDNLFEALSTGGEFGYCFWNDFHRVLDVVVCTENFDDGDYVNKLSHEINHAIDRIIDNANINDTEARSYLTGWIYHNLREKGFI